LLLEHRSWEEPFGSQQEFAAVTEMGSRTIITRKFRNNIQIIRPVGMNKPR
jgi:hypothetical protein